MFTEYLLWENFKFYNRFNLESLKLTIATYTLAYVVFRDGPSDRVDYVRVFFKYGEEKSGTVWLPPGNRGRIKYTTFLKYYPLLCGRNITLSDNKNGTRSMPDHPIAYTT